MKLTISLLRKIGLLGGECTGKTTLAHALRDHLDALVVPEYLREYVITMGRTPTELEQAGIMQTQIAAEGNALAVTGEQTLIVCDPAALMTAIYSIAYFGDSSLLESAVQHAQTYRTLIWCGTDIPWEPDGDQRDGPAYRAQVDALIAEVVRNTLEPAGIEVHRIDGTIAQRLQSVLRLLDHEVAVGQPQQAWQQQRGAGGT